MIWISPFWKTPQSFLTGAGILTEETHFPFTRISSRFDSSTIGVHTSTLSGRPVAVQGTAVPSRRKAAPLTSGRSSTTLVNTFSLPSRVS